MAVRVGPVEVVGPDGTGSDECPVGRLTGRFGAGDVVDEVGVVFDELRGVVVDTGLGSLEGCLQLDRVIGVPLTAGHDIRRRDCEHREQRDDRDDEHQSLAVLAADPDTDTLEHQLSNAVPRIVPMAE